MTPLFYVKCEQSNINCIWCVCMLMELIRGYIFMPMQSCFPRKLYFPHSYIQAHNIKWHRWRFTSPKVHWSEGSLVRISEWPYGVYTWKAVQCFPISKVKHHFRVRDGVRVRVRIRACNFRTSDPSDQWTFGLVTSNHGIVHFDFCLLYNHLDIATTVVFHFSLTGHF